MNTNSERILAILEYCNMKAGDFAETVGVAPATISNIKNGKSSFTASIAQKIITSFPNFSFQWILLGEGNMLQGSDNNNVKSNFTPIKPQTDELFPIDSDDEQEKSNLPTYSNDTVTPSQINVPVNRVETNSGIKATPQSAASSGKTTPPSSQNRSIEKIIIYYSDKTFEEYDMTKCKL